MSDAAITLVLWCIAGLILGWTWIPAFIAGLGGTRYSIEGSEDPTVLAPTGPERDYAAWHKRVAALGYDPLGSMRMRITCHGPVWRYEIHARVFRSRSKQAYAFIQKQPWPLDSWSLAMFATCWNDGSLLLTSNAAQESPDDGGYVVQGTETSDLAVAEQLHLATCERMKEAGKRPDPEGGLEPLLTAIRLHAGKAARYVGLKIGQTYLVPHVLIHVIVSAPLVYMNGIGHWSVPLANVILGSLMAAAEYTAKRRAGKMLKAQAEALAGGEMP
jgi:hypothetical protein